MSEKINITMPEVSQAAKQMRLYNDKMDDVLSFVKRTMNDLCSIWSSDSQISIVENFNNFAKRFVIESEEIDKYATFLDHIVSTYGNLENTIDANAKNINS